MIEHRRRILLDGVVTEVRLDGDDLLAADGRRVPAAQARHLPPVVQGGGASPPFDQLADLAFLDC